MITLLDTNVYAAMRRGNHAVQRRIRQSRELILSSIVIGELLFGFRNGSRYERNIHDLERFVASPYVRAVAVTRTTADRYGRIAATLRAKGKPIPTNDIWIAAHAFETGAELLSFDDHFQWVDGLVWALPS